MIKEKREKMRLLIIMISSMLGITWLYASDIDAQIAKIQQASPKERYKLVNQLKEQIAHFNALEQARSISKYQESSLNHQQQAAQANQLSIEETLKRSQTDDTFVPQAKILPKMTPKILPSNYPSKKTILPKIETPTIPQNNHQIPTPIYNEPTYEAPTPIFKQAEYKTPIPNYEIPVDTYKAPTYDKPKPIPTPTFEPTTIPTTSKRGGF